MNQGKVFENAIKNSIPSGIMYYRIPDPMESFSQVKTGLRFTLKNPCDILLFNPKTKTMYALELKSTQNTSLSFWKEDFVNKKKNQTFMIKENQIKGLKHFSEYNIISGFLINFRSTKHTYFLSIDDYLKMVDSIEKKSFNECDVIRNNGFKIDQVLLKVNYRYDMETFLNTIYVK